MISSVVLGACAVLLPCASLTGTDEHGNIKCSAIRDCAIS